MSCAEMPLAAATDGLFSQRFKHISKNGVPAYGIVASTVLASIAMIINYLGSNGATVFTTLVLRHQVRRLSMRIVISNGEPWSSARAAAAFPPCTRCERKAGTSGPR
jgi:L-asparagine transporter-like permease